MSGAPGFEKVIANKRMSNFINIFFTINRCLGYILRALKGLNILIVLVNMKTSDPFFTFFRPDLDLIAEFFEGVLYLTICFALFAVSITIVTLFVRALVYIMIRLGVRLGLFPGPAQKIRDERERFVFEAYMFSGRGAWGQMPETRWERIKKSLRRFWEKNRSNIIEVIALIIMGVTAWWAVKAILAYFVQKQLDNSSSINKEEDLTIDVDFRRWWGVDTLRKEYPDRDVKAVSNSNGEVFIYVESDKEGVRTQVFKVDKFYRIREVPERPKQEAINKLNLTVFFGSLLTIVICKKLLKITEAYYHFCLPDFTILVEPKIEAQSKFSKFMESILSIIFDEEDFGIFITWALGGLLYLVEMLRRYYNSGYNPPQKGPEEAIKHISGSEPQSASGSNNKDDGDKNPESRWNKLKRGCKNFWKEWGPTIIVGLEITATLLALYGGYRYLSKDSKKDTNPPIPPKNPTISTDSNSAYIAEVPGTYKEWGMTLLGQSKYPRAKIWSYEDSNGITTIYMYTDCLNPQLTQLYKGDDPYGGEGVSQEHFHDFFSRATRTVSHGLDEFVETRIVYEFRMTKDYMARNHAYYEEYIPKNVPRNIHKIGLEEEKKKKNPIDPNRRTKNGSSLYRDDHNIY